MTFILLTGILRYYLIRMKLSYIIIIVFFTLSSNITCYGGSSNELTYLSDLRDEPDSGFVNKKRLVWLVGSKTVALTGTMLILDQMWYSNYPRTSFQFFDDSRDWKQMDKLGHVTSAYHLSAAGADTFRWTGLTNRQSALYGSITGTLFMTTIEVLDGFSEEWGFSWADQAANFIGAGMFYTQQLIWEEQKFKMRYSYRSSGLQEHRPDLFGSNLAEHLLKDYNGMTFWLSTNMNIFSQKREIFPSWLNIAIGYSANGMLGSTENPAVHNGQILPEMERYRQWFISPDIDFSRIETDSQFLIFLFKALDFVKLPSPALEYNRKYGWGVHLVYF